jgi:hypothetical protein
MRRVVRTPQVASAARVVPTSVVALEQRREGAEDERDDGCDADSWHRPHRRVAAHADLVGRGDSARGSSADRPR